MGFSAWMPTGPRDRAGQVVSGWITRVCAGGLAGERARVWPKGRTETPADWMIGKEDGSSLQRMDELPAASGGGKINTGWASRRGGPREAIGLELMLCRPIRESNPFDDRGQWSNRCGGHRPRGGGMRWDLRDADLRLELNLLGLAVG